MNSKIPHIIDSTSDLPFVLFYQGDFSTAPTLSMINIVEKHFANSAFNIRTLVYLIIEAVQNIERYSSHINECKDCVLIYSDGNYNYIITENSIPTSKSESLKAKLDEVLLMDKSELDSAYKKVIKSDIRTEKGAGLGIIDIARKSKSNLFYSLEQINEDYSRYSLNVVIPVDKKNEDVVKYNPEDTLSILNSFKNGFGTNASSLFYGGDFSNKFIFSLLNFLKTTKKANKQSINTKTHHLLVELIQNIKKYAHTVNEITVGKLAIEWKESSMIITTFNEVEGINRDRVIVKTELLNSFNHQQLIDYNKTQLLDMTQDNGLGLIDVALLIYPEKIECQSTKKNEVISDLLLSITINYE